MASNLLITLISFVVAINFHSKIHTHTHRETDIDTHTHTQTDRAIDTHLQIQEQDRAQKARI